MSGGTGLSSLARVMTIAMAWVTASLATPVPTPAQAPDSGSFVLLVGADTFAVEHFTRRAGGARSELVGPSIGRILFDVDTSPDESVTRMAIQYWAAGTTLGDPPNQAATITIERDTAVVVITSPPEIEPQRFATAEGAFLYLNPSFLLIEQMVRHAREVGGEIVTFTAFLAQGAETAQVRVLDAASGSVGIVFGSRINAAVDTDGRLRSATLPDQGLTVVRDGGP